MSASNSLTVWIFFIFSSKDPQHRPGVLDVTQITTDLFVANVVRKLINTNGIATDAALVVFKLSNFHGPGVPLIHETRIGWFLIVVDVLNDVVGFVRGASNDESLLISRHCLVTPVCYTKCIIDPEFVILVWVPFQVQVKEIFKPLT